MGKPMPAAGRPHKTPGSQPAPRTPGATTGTIRDRAQGAAPGNQTPADPKPTPQGGPGS